mgnify:CR=1 FL=1
MFLAKWTADGVPVWSKQWGTNDQQDEANSVAVDGNGDVFVTGWTNGSLDDNTNAGVADIFLTKWSSNGTKAWTEQWGTDGYDWGEGVVVDNMENIFVTGYTNGSLDGNNKTGGNDLFLTKWKSSGTKAWTRQWGSSSPDYGKSVATDDEGNIFVTGYTEGSFEGNTIAGYHDPFLTKWNADGTKAWTKQWGSSNSDYGNSVIVDNGGNIFVAGYTMDALDGNTNAGEADIFLTKWLAE